MAGKTHAVACRSPQLRARREPAARVVSIRAPELGGYNLCLPRSASSLA
jgi:hypothetical protein